MDWYGIRRVLVRADIEGMIERGAPDDEYDDEARHVANSIRVFHAKYPNGALTLELLVNFLLETWRDSFELSEAELAKRKEPLRKVAAELLRISLQ